MLACAETQARTEDPEPQTEKAAAAQTEPLRHVWPRRPAADRLGQDRNLAADGTEEGSPNRQTKQTGLPKMPNFLRRRSRAQTLAAGR